MQKEQGNLGIKRPGEDLETNLDSKVPKLVYTNVLPISHQDITKVISRS
ncbi:hypothetical protein [Cardinium endosymbiont of Tipula unca]